MNRIDKFSLPVMWLIVFCLGTGGSLRGAEQATELLDLPGYRMPYLDIGGGEPIVFVHGALSDYRLWLPAADLLADKYRVIAYTRRYYGSQPWREDPPVYNHDQHAADLAALIEHLKLEAVNLVSWSSGAISATILANRRPELVNSIVHYEPVIADILHGVDGVDALAASWGEKWGPVVDAVKTGNNDEAARKMAELAFELPSGGFSSLPEMNQKIILDNSRTIGLILNASEHVRLDCDLVGQIKAPTLVILGEKTNEWWSLISESVANCLPNGSLMKMKGVNHNGPLADVEMFVGLLESFITEHK